MLALVLLIVLPLQGFTASRMLFIGLPLHGEAADRIGSAFHHGRSDAAAAHLRQLAPSAHGDAHTPAADGENGGQTAAHCLLCWFCNFGLISSGSAATAQSPLTQVVTPTEFLPPPARTVPVPRKPPRA